MRKYEQTVNNIIKLELGDNEWYDNRGNLRQPVI